MLRRLQLAQTRRYLGTVVRKAPSVRSTVGVTTSGTPSGSTNTSSDNNAWLNNSSETILSKKKLLGETLGGFTLETNSPVSYTSVSSSDVDWSVSFRGLGSSPFEEKVQAELSKPLSSDDIEVKPDGLVYLPEIKYRRILNKAFGAGGWGLVPRSDTIVTAKLVTREYALICHGQLVSISRGEQDYFNESGIPTATEGCKSNALMRCCKDLGIGSELWDPVFIKEFKKANCVEKFVEHVTTKKKKKIWLKKGREVEYPYK